MATHKHPFKAIRLVMAFDEKGMHLAGATGRLKPAPASADVRAEPPTNSFSVEVRLPGGEPVYRRLLANLIPQSVEVFDDAGPRRLQPPPVSGGFAVVVPAMDQSADVVIEAGADVTLEQPAFAAAERQRGRRRELASFRLPAVR